MINVQEINICESDTWKRDFFKNIKYRNIASLYDFVIFSYKEMTFLKAMMHHTVYETPRVFLKDYKILDAIPYYYINFLLETQPTTIVDLGCGTNYFKPHLPGLIGIDGDLKSAADVFDYFDYDFVKGHQQQFDALISINTIHFAPITEIAQRLEWVASLVKPGGRGFVTFNIETWLMHTPSEQFQNIFGAYPNFCTVINYVNEQIVKTGLKFLIVDWPILRISEHSTIRDELNGNVRLVFDV